MNTTQRSTIRRSVRLPLSIGRRLPALTADVSRGGFSAELPQVFLPGSKIDGYFLVGDTEVPFVGTVAWATPGNPQASLYSRIGVEFIEQPKGLNEVFVPLESKPRTLKKKVRKSKK